MSFDGGSAIGVLHRRRHVRLPEVVRECVHDDECMAVDADGAGRLAVGAAVRVTDLLPLADAGAGPGIRRSQ
jgi:hypothetical protein